MDKTPTLTVKLPDDFSICPLAKDSQKTMSDPVVAVDGYTYERANIEEWFKKHNTSPITGETLTNKSLRPNLVIKNLIEQKDSVGSGTVDSLIEDPLTLELFKNPVVITPLGHTYSEVTLKKWLNNRRAEPQAPNRSLTEKDLIRNKTLENLINKLKPAEKEALKDSTEQTPPKPASTESPLLAAVRYNQLNMVRNILKSTDINAEELNIALELAIDKGHTEISKTLSAELNNINDTKNEHGDTALILAAQTGDIERVKELIDSGANTDIQNDDGNTALIIAIIRGQTAVAKELIDHGADINTKSYAGGTALIEASYSGNTEIVKILIKYGVSINEKNKYGDTALHWAAVHGHIKTLETLLDNGADINAVQNGHCTAFFLVAKSSNTKIAKILLERGANINIEDKDGNTALYWADYYKRNTAILIREYNKNPIIYIAENLRMNNFEFFKEKFENANDYSKYRAIDIISGRDKAQISPEILAFIAKYINDKQNQQKLSHAIKKESWKRTAISFLFPPLGVAFLLYTLFNKPQQTINKYIENFRTFLPQETKREGSYASIVTTLEVNPQQEPSAPPLPEPKLTTPSVSPTPERKPTAPSETALEPANEGRSKAPRQ